MNTQVKINTTNKSGILFIVYTTIIFITLALLLSGCESSTDPGLNGENNENGTSPPPASNEVTMTASSFAPGTLTVQTGTTVTWINTSNEVHTVTSGSDGEHDDLFNSGNMNPDDEFEFTFEDEGTFPYFCIPHLNMGMTGTIIVSDDANGDNQGNGDDNDNNNNNDQGGNGNDSGY
jgi:plastocyanin